MMSCTSSTASHWRAALPHNRRRSPSFPPASLASHQAQNAAFRKLKQSSTASASASALPFDLSPPPIDHDLLETATVEGAKVSEDGIVETYHNDDEALDAAKNGVAVVDLSQYGRIRVTLMFAYPYISFCFGLNWHEVSGEDRIQFLHNQSTANFESLHEGQGCDTVFVTPTARTIDIAHAWIMKTAITMVVSPMTSGSITEMLNKYIFFADKVEIQDITKQTCLFVLVGPKSNKVMEDLNLADLVGQPYGSHKHFSVSGMPITVAVGNVISEEGFSFLMPPAAAGSIWRTFVSLGAIPMGSKAWETLRIFQGRPAPGKELTNDFNVLEAGLWNSISLNKGCYKGQETISRLVTYDGIKQRLWGIHLSSAAQPGDLIKVDGKKVGKLTSYAAGRTGSEHFGLGYIKRQAASKGDTVIVGEDIIGTVVEVPYLARQRRPLFNSKP
ncbi:hypothetical protein RJ639_011713 [Escallonia herrerae]|uniref:Aminomethyltransferase folate-binding domain-containing protein n=1 Tax=Escallonia herrerae TaxID=1293975 RepID=A0AA89ATG5_9ASTE|nr:hypothetical protein RJ639_011713 [Escallonia herrerae]